MILYPILYFPVRNSISVSVSSPVLLSGIYMYTGTDTDLLDESIEIVFDRGTTILSLYRDNKLVAQTVCDAGT